MRALTPGQVRTRARVELVIALAAPLLDLLLATGDRVSRLIEPHDLGWEPPRRVSAGHSQELVR